MLAATPALQLTPAKIGRQPRLTPPYTTVDAVRRGEAWEAHLGHLGLHTPCEPKGQQVGATHRGARSRPQPWPPRPTHAMWAQRPTRWRHTPWHREADSNPGTPDLPTPCEPKGQRAGEIIRCNPTQRQLAGHTARPASAHRGTNQKGGHRTPWCHAADPNLGHSAPPRM